MWRLPLAIERYIIIVVFGMRFYLFSLKEDLKSAAAKREGEEPHLRSGQTQLTYSECREMQVKDLL